jgi:hypothetical protein
MMLSIELNLNRFTTEFVQFRNIVCEQSWIKRVSVIKGTIRGNKILAPLLLEENTFAFALTKCSDLYNRYGTVLVPGVDSRPLYGVMAFVTQVNSIVNALPRAKSKAFVGRVRGSFRNTEDLRALKLELTAATHFLRRGHIVSWPEFDGTGTNDLLVDSLGPNGLEVECKAISRDKGRKIHRREAMEFQALLQPSLSKLAGGISNGLCLVLTLHDRLPSMQAKRMDLAKAVLSNVMSCHENVELQDSILRVTSFPKNALDVRFEDGRVLFSQDNIESITGTSNRELMVTGTPDGGAIIFVVQSAQEDDFLGRMFETLADAANRQLTKSRAGMLLVGFQDIDSAELVELADLDAGLDTGASALRRQVSAFLSKESRAHLVGTGFLCKNAVELNVNAEGRLGGTSYHFSKRDSTYWDNAFEGLFDSR